MRLTPDAPYPTAAVVRTGVAQSFSAPNDAAVHITAAPITTARGTIGVLACGHRGPTAPPIPIVAALADEAGRLISQRRAPRADGQVATG